MTFRAWFDDYRGDAIEIDGGTAEEAAIALVRRHDESQDTHGEIAWNEAQVDVSVRRLPRGKVRRFTITGHAVVTFNYEVVR